MSLHPSDQHSLELLRTASDELQLVRAEMLRYTVELIREAKSRKLVVRDHSGNKLAEIPLMMAAAATAAAVLGGWSRWLALLLALGMFARAYLTIEKVEASQAEQIKAPTALPEPSAAALEATSETPAKPAGRTRKRPAAPRKE
jgi:hypothetical protein